MFEYGNPLFKVLTRRQNYKLLTGQQRFSVPRPPGPSTGSMLDQKQNTFKENNTCIDELPILTRGLEVNINKKFPKTYLEANK